MQKIKTVFFGSGNFAVKILKGILDMPFLDVVAIVTQPDKEAGRKKELTPCPVAQEILEAGIKLPVYKPVKLRLEAEKILAETAPEFVLVADYGQIIPAVIIDYPKYKCLNIHGSLLPDLRGAVPAPVAILKGYTRTGVSIPVMTPGLDDGAVVAMRETDILPEDTAISLRLRLGDVGVELAREVLPDWFAGKITPVPQDESKATITRQSDIAKEKAQITRETAIIDAERMVRAFYPWPVAWINVLHNGQVKRVKILKASIEKDCDPSLPEFAIVKLGKKLYLKLKDGCIELAQLQLEGKKAGSAQDYLFLNKAGLSEK